MKKFISFIIILFVNTAFADIPDIVAVVNDKPITKYDFEPRRKMAILLSNIDTSNPTISARLNQDILNILIEEEMLNQHLEKIGRKISKEELSNAISSMEQQRKMQKGGIKEYLSEKGVDMSSFEKQIRGELIKHQIINSLSQSVSVSEEELQFTAINADQNLEVEAWVFTSKKNDNDSFEKMKNLRRKLYSCNKMDEKIYQKFADGEKFDRNLKEMQNNTKSVVVDTQVGSSGSVYQENGRFKLVFVCKKDNKASDNELNKIKSFLSNKKMSQKAQKFFKDLKEKSYIQKMI